MKKRYAAIFVLLILNCANILFMPIPVRAELSVKLMPAIDTQILRIGSRPGRDDSQRMLIKAHASREHVKFRWDVDRMPEKSEEAEFLYCPPESIAGKAEWVTITVTAIDEEKGESAADSVKFLLVPWDIKGFREELKKEIEKDKPVERLKYLAKALSQNNEHYKKFTRTEQLERVSVNDRIIPVLLDSIEKLKELENFAENDQVGFGKTERKQLEQELVTRLSPTLKSTLAEVHDLDCPPQPPKLEELLSRALPQDLEQFRDLIHREKQGEQLNPQVIAAIERIICDLRAIERILEEHDEQKPDPRVQERIQKSRVTRQQYEQERIDRLREVP